MKCNIFYFQFFRLPVPFIPPVHDIMSFTFLLDSFVLAVLGFCISLSMGKPIAKLFNYELDATDELWAEVNAIISLILYMLKSLCFEYLF